MVRTNTLFPPASPRGMRIALREVEAPTSLATIRTSLDSRMAEMLEREASGGLQPTRWLAHHRRPDVTSASSEHGTDTPTSHKARARRLAAIIGQMQISRAHRHNLSCTRLATL